MSSKQQLQRDRAYFKFVLSGLIKPVNIKSLTEAEKSTYATIIVLRDKLINEFDSNSRQLGLNVPEHKCWCGKPAKHCVEIFPDDEFSKFEWVCNKHKKYD